MLIRLLIIMLFLSSCKKKISVLKGTVNFITSKNRVYTSTFKNNPNAYIYKGESYSLQERYEFDNNGFVKAYGFPKSLGLVYHYRKPDTMQLPLNTNYLDYKISIDTVNNYIVDNKDTLRNFHIYKKGKQIFFPKNGNGNVIIFEFN